MLVSDLRELIFNAQRGPEVLRLMYKIIKKNAAHLRVLDGVPVWSLGPLPPLVLERFVHRDGQSEPVLFVHSLINVG